MYLLRGEIIMIDGQKIKDTRKKLGISQQDLAKGITTQGTISLLERNSTSPRGDILAKIIARLGLKLEDVVVDNEVLTAQRFLDEADKFSMNNEYDRALETLDKIDKLSDNEQEAHYLFLKTNAKMWKTRDFEDALFGFNRILQMRNKQVDIFTVLATCELGVVYLERKENDKASFYFEQVPGLLENINLDDYVFWALFIWKNLTLYYYRMMDFDKCAEILAQAEEFSNRHFTPVFIDSLYYTNALVLHDKNGEWTKDGIKYLLKSWAFATFTDNKENIKKSSEILTEIGYLPN
jgi:transcriptional regulator with XRE-family HTH domain